MKKKINRTSIFLKQSLSLLLVLFIISSCNKNQTVTNNLTPELFQIPEGFPEIDFPMDNEFTKARWNLGKKLFYDPILSKDSSLSCATCHKPALSFADDKAFSPGIENRAGVRNSPSLANVAYQPYFLREGGVPTLEMQILVPIQESKEFNHNIVAIADQLNNQPEYVQLSQEAYGRKPDPFVITRAIATFERSLISGNSPYDQWRNGDNSALSETEKRGKDLFFSNKTNCSACHSGFNFTNYAFENNGLDTVYSDVGRYRLTSKEEHRATFKIPSLRNVGLTAPYMHNGSILTLADVIEHYNQGGKSHKNKSALVKPLNLTTTEKSDLVAFLQSLTDHEFITNTNFK